MTGLCFLLECFRTSSAIKSDLDKQNFTLAVISYMEDKQNFTLAVISYMEVSLFRTYCLKFHNEHILLQYNYGFPVDSDCYATKGNEAMISIQFSELSVSFLTSSNVSMADIQVSDILITAILTETEMPSSDGVCCVTHTFNGCLSKLNKVLQTFKAGPIFFFYLCRDNTTMYLLY